MTQLRIATFNAALARPSPGQLAADMRSGADRQARAVADIIGLVRPDVLILNEFDYDASGTALADFQANYLRNCKTSPIEYPHLRVFATNSGHPSPVDLNGDGLIQLPEDGLGYGAFPGQYGLALLSRFAPIDSEQRSWQHFLWQDMPESNLPADYYTNAAQAVLPLSSKNHLDITLVTPDSHLHLLVCHPTPPVFDGASQQNRRRNFDELRMFSDYLSERGADYLYDDNGSSAGLAAQARFVLAGDFNADPHYGASRPGAIAQLLDHPRVHPDVARGAQRPASVSGCKIGRPHATAGFNDGLRVDYLLPSANIVVLDSGIFWPTRGSQHHHLIDNDLSSDHRLVWMDIQI